MSKRLNLAALGFNEEIFSIRCASERRVMLLKSNFPSFAWRIKKEENQPERRLLDVLEFSCKSSSESRKITPSLVGLLTGAGFLYTSSRESLSNYREEFFCH
jgi:hypothetical protein